MAYTMSRVGALVTVVVLVVFGFQATGWQSEARARKDCKTVLLPALRDVVRSKPAAPSALDDFAKVHGLTLKTTTFRLPIYQTPRRTVSPTPSPSKTGTSTITTYLFPRNGTTVLSWSDGSCSWGPNPACKV